MPPQKGMGRGAWLRDLPAVRGIAQRGTVRIDLGNVRCHITANIGVPISATTVMLDFSASGALLESPLPLAVGTEVTCRFTLPRAVEFNLKAVVARTLAPRPPSKYVRLGVRFLIRPGTDSQLMGWIFKEMARRKQSSY